VTGHGEDHLDLGGVRGRRVEGQKEGRGNAKAWGYCAQSHDIKHKLPAELDSDHRLGK